MTTIVTFVRVTAALALLLGAQQLLADEFPAITNSERLVDAQPLPPDVAAAGFTRLPQNVTARLFAAEPEVQNPIAMAWDARGRLWIAENYTYAERSQRFDLGLRDRVVVLDDRDGDGKPDQRHVFTDQVQMLTGLEVGHGSVWLLCPPQLLRFPDANGDAQADGPAEIILDGFEVAEDNYHNFANGLRWGPDGWLYGRCGGSCPGRVGPPNCSQNDRIALEGGIWRYHVQRKQFEVLCHGTTNPWGHDWDEWGEGFFINTVNGHLWHLIPGAHFERPFTLDPNPYVYELLGMHADHWHFDTSGEWFESRNGEADRFGGGHAHVGMMIYLGHRWPVEYRGRLFTWNIHGRRANQELLVRSGSGYVARHCPDVLQSNDSFFRGMELSYGPDGNVYTIDWSDTGECHEHTGVHRTSGRIFCFSVSDDISEEPQNSQLSPQIIDNLNPEGEAAGSSRTRQSQFDLRSLTESRLVELHQHPNEWFIRQSRLALAERAAALDLPLEDANPQLREAVDRLGLQLQGSDDRLAYQSMMTLACMGCLSDLQLDGALQHTNEHLRAWAVRLMFDEFPIDSIMGRCRQRQSPTETRLRKLIQLAGSDPSGLVRLALASTLQRLPLDARCPLARALMSRSQDAHDQNLPLMVWYGLIPVAETYPQQLAELAVASAWPTTQRLAARRIASLIEEFPGATETLLQGCMQVSPEVRLNLLLGISQGLKGWPSAPQPSQWPELLKQVSLSGPLPIPLQNQQNAVLQELAVVFGDGVAIEKIREVVCNESEDISLRRSALESLVAGRHPEIDEICLSVLGDARLNSVALRGLARSGKTEIASALIKNYYRFRSPNRRSVVALLTTRPGWTRELLHAVEQNRIPKEHLTAYDVRQMIALQEADLTQQLEKIWGKIRLTPGDRLERIDAIQSLVRSTPASDHRIANGRVLFNRQCALCHRLFGSGNKIGPDLTGSNRQDLDYLIENIVDPSAVVSKDYRNSLIVMVDGRTLSGLVVNRSDKTLELQTQSEKLTLPVEEIQQISPTSNSPMPDGLLENLSPQDIIDLVAYLRHPTQIPLPDE